MNSESFCQESTHDPLGAPVEGFGAVASIASAVVGYGSYVIGSNPKRDNQYRTMGVLNGLTQRLNIQEEAVRIAADEFVRRCGK